MDLLLTMKHLFHILCQEQKKVRVYCVLLSQRHPRDGLCSSQKMFYCSQDVISLKSSFLACAKLMCHSIPSFLTFFLCHFQVNVSPPFECYFHDCHFTLCSLSWSDDPMEEALVCAEG